MADENKFIATETNESDAHHIIKYHLNTKDVSGKDKERKEKPLEIRDICNLQLAIDKNPNKFTDAERSFVAAQAQRAISDVAHGRHKLDVRETDVFEEVLKHAPQHVKNDTTNKYKESREYIKASQKWYNTENGIEEPSLSDKIMDLAMRGKDVTRLSSIKFPNREKMFNWAKKFANNLGLGKNNKKETKNKEDKTGFSLSEQWKKLKNSKFWKISKTIVNWGIVKAVKAGKAIYNGVVDIYNNVSQYRAEKKAIKQAKAKEPAKTKKAAEKSARGDLNNLTPEQIAANWALIGRGESDGRYRMAQQAERVLEAIAKKELDLNEDNAPTIAAWLEVNRDIQDRVNHNKVEAKNERNNAIAAQLEALKEKGSDSKGKTEATKEDEAHSPTVTTNTAEEQRKTDVNQQIPTEKMDKIKAEMKVLAEFKEQFGKESEEYGSMRDMMTAELKDSKEGFGLNDVQINAIKNMSDYKDLFAHEQSNPLKPQKTSTVADIKEEIKKELKEKENPLASLSQKDKEELISEYDKMAKQYHLCKKRGGALNDNTADALRNVFEEKMTKPKDKGGMGLTPEQAEAFKETRSGENGVFPASKDNTPTTYKPLSQEQMNAVAKEYVARKVNA